MKKFILVLALIVSTVVFALNTTSTVNQATMQPRNGQMVDNDGKIVNEVNGLSKIQFNSTASTLNYLSTFDSQIKIIEIELHYTAAVTGTVTVTKKFATANYNTVRKTATLTSNTDIAITDVIYLDKGDQINIVGTGGTTPVYVTITYSKVVR